jgi:gluconate 2-dehydrogenase gamma chain
MDRREVLRLLAAGTVLQMAPKNLLGLLREAHTRAESQSAPRSLNPHQFALVKTLVDMIIPRTNTPGAVDVGAPEFIDLILTDWMNEQEKASFLDGLANVDGRSRKLFGRDFVKCFPVQQVEILMQLGEEMEQDVAGDQTRRPEGQPNPDKNFYVTLRWLILTAYYTSEDGAEKELHFQIIPDRVAGCAEIDAKTPSGRPGRESQ